MITNKLISFSIITLGVGILLVGFGLTSSQNMQSTPGVSTGVKQEVHTGSESISSGYVVDKQETSVSGLEGERGLVTKVIDGDTIEVLISGSKFNIRLLGVDTPETVDPRKSVQCFGKEASNEAKSLLSGKQVILQKDVSDTDMYKRLLRHIYLPLEDGNFLFVNDYLIREGFGKVLTIPPDAAFSEQFLDAQREAREVKKGLWGKC